MSPHVPYWQPSKSSLREDSKLPLGATGNCKSTGVNLIGIRPVRPVSFREPHGGSHDSISRSAWRRVADSTSMTTVLVLGQRGRRTLELDFSILRSPRLPSPLRDTRHPSKVSIQSGLLEIRLTTVPGGPPRAQAQ